MAFDRASESMGKRREQVESYVLHHPGVTNDDISLALDLPIQTVTPTTFDLKASGRLWIVGHKATRTGRTAASHDVARCPECGRTGNPCAEIEPGLMHYTCNCGTSYRAYVGVRHDKPACIVRGVERWPSP